jgi:exopolysaccharide biosynthesis polyprenyl glycosylphosphotransferase
METMNPRPRFTLALLLGDLSGVFVVFNTMALLRGLAYWPDLLVWPLLVPALLLVTILALFDGYSPRTDYLSLDYLSQHLLASVLAILGTLLFTFVIFSGDQRLQSSRGVILLSFLALAPLGILMRRSLALRRAAVRRDHGVVYIGDEASALDFATECKRLGHDRPMLHVALKSEAASSRCPSAEDVVARIELGELAADAIILRESSGNLPAGLPDRLMRLHFDGVPTYTLERYHEQVWRKIPLYRINPVWLFQGGFQLARDPLFERAKRVSDLFLAFVGLLLAAPFLLVAALAIRLGDGGPVFFRQIRVGRHRHPFALYKLRTMRVAPAAPDASDAGRYTAKADPRVTRVGRLLRATRLDEFPQLWNVIKGDMSMIGPRAEWDALVADYEKQIPCYHFRHLVRPGITGWGQVNYPYGANLEDTLRKLEYDLYYIRHYSFRLDAAIVLKTMHVMLTAKGGR